MSNPRGGNMKRYEITFLDTGITVVWTARQAQKHFGKLEWIEYKNNYAPDIFVIEHGIW
jgi:hypothetical protein